MRTDPEAAEQADQAARESLGAWVGASTERGTKTVFVRADAPDVIRFDATLDRVADSLSILGDPRSKDQRRAAALGWLANPQATLDLFDQTADSLGITLQNPPAPQAASPTSNPRPDPRPPATLYVHLTETTPPRDGGWGGEGGGVRTRHRQPASVLAVQQPGHRETGDRPDQPDPGRRLRDPDPGPRSHPPHLPRRLLPLRHLDQPQRRPRTTPPPTAIPTKVVHPAKPRSGTSDP